jgi:predicted ATPase
LNGKSLREPTPLVIVSESNVIPTALLFARYRAFRETTRLDLAPLTVIIGKNGGGKSVLTRMPLLLASGLSSDAEAPLDLNAGGINHAARYEDLIYQRSAQPFMLGAEISDGERTHEFRTTLLHVVENHTLAIEAFDLFEGGERIVSLKARPEDIGGAQGAFLARFGLDEAEHPVNVLTTGLFPTAISGRAALSNRLLECRVLFEKAFQDPSYLGPFRSEQGLLTRIPRQGVRDLGPRGERALDILGDNRLRGDGALVDAVENWFESEMGGNRVKLEMAGDIPRMLVHDPIRNLDIDIGETGAGFAQLFPIVVQAYARRSDAIKGSIIIVEQPELHLHPAAHGSVADLIANIATTRRDGVRYVCETHSEQFVTRLRRRIAENLFPADAVKIVSVGHQSTVEDDIEPLRMIEIDRLGNPDAWPVGVFDEAFDDLVQLRKAAQFRLAAEAPKEA